MDEEQKGRWTVRPKWTGERWDVLLTMPHCQPLLIDAQSAHDLGEALVLGAEQAQSQSAPPRQ